VHRTPFRHPARVRARAIGTAFSVEDFASEISEFKVCSGRFPQGLEHHFIRGL